VIIYIEKRGENDLCCGTQQDGPHYLDKNLTSSDSDGTAFQHHESYQLTMCPLAPPLRPDQDRDRQGFFFFLFLSNNFS